MTNRVGGVWVRWLVAGLLAAAAGVFVLINRLAQEQLDNLDKVASVVSAIVAVASVPMVVHSLVLARRALAGPDSAGIRQDVRAGRDAYVAGRDQHFGQGPDRR